MLVAALWRCTWGRDWEGAMEPTLLSTGPQSFTPLPTIKLGPSGANSWVSGPVHTLGPCGSLQQPLLWGWESLLLLPQPPRAFSIRGLRLYFPALEPWVMRSALLPAVCPVYLCASVGPQGATPRSACPVLHHSESGPPGLSVRMWGRRVCQWSDCLPCSSHTPPVSVPPRQLESSPPQLPVSAPPTGLDECLFFISLVSDFLAIWFSVSSGCARRRSVSTYAAILVLLQLLCNFSYNCKPTFAPLCVIIILYYLHSLAIGFTEQLSYLIFKIIWVSGHDGFYFTEKKLKLE